MKKIEKNEAILQAELYHQCRLRNIDCEIEAYVALIGRLDALISFAGRKYCVECKNIDKDKINFNTRQFNRYKKLKLPIIIITSREDIEALMLAIMSDIKFCEEIYLYSSNLKYFYKYS